MPRIDIEAALSSSSAATFCMSEFSNPDWTVQLASTDRQEEARTAAINLGNVIDRLAEKSNAIKLLHEFGLSTAAPGKKSPTELLEAACAAFEKQVTQGCAASTSLIPMRECINSTVAALLQRRHEQEPAKSRRHKILSIGRQAARSGIANWAIESIAMKWEKMSDELSSSKQKDVSREEWMAILRRAMILLIEFLQSLDQTKLR